MKLWYVIWNTLPNHRKKINNLFLSFTLQKTQLFNKSKKKKLQLYDLVTHYYQNTSFYYRKINLYSIYGFPLQLWGHLH